MYIKELGRRWSWPEADDKKYGARAAVFSRLADLQAVLKTHVPKDRRRLAVQAGGNMGVWPWELSKSFESVITFEPDMICWVHMQRNLAPEYCKGRVLQVRLALGDNEQEGWMIPVKANLGAQWVSFIETADVPKVRIAPLDSWELQDLDFLQLDVEGAEFPALRGAEATLRRCRPVLMIEEKGHGERYGYGPERIQEWLASLGYARLEIIGRDVVYAHIESKDLCISLTKPTPSAS
jgi:FkbM family methyltransferase